MKYQELKEQIRELLAENIRLQKKLKEAEKFNKWAEGRMIFLCKKIDRLNKQIDSFSAVSLGFAIGIIIVFIIAGVWK